jgi:hypothetical protein
MFKLNALHSSNGSYPLFFPNGQGPFLPTCTVPVIEIKSMQGGTGGHGGSGMSGTGRGGRGGKGKGACIIQTAGTVIVNPPLLNAP